MESSKRTDPFLDRLGIAMERLGPPVADARRYAVAFSGGLDSTVLLTALCRMPAPPPLRALHVNHGLSADADRWSRHCTDFAEALGVACAAGRVQVVTRGAGLEAAARQARYAALAAMLEPEEVLLTAHHADDQLETVLLRLLRGAGVEGLAATRPLVPFARGYLARPLLNFSREDIRRQAERWRLEWLDDPSNEDVRHDRNFLRHQVVPLLRRRWPAAARSAARLAQQMRDAEEVLAAMAEHDLDAGDSAPVDVARLRALSAARQRNLLRHLIRRAALPTPTAAQLEQLRASLSVRRRDAETRVAWPGAEAHVHRERLYLLAPLAEPGGGEAASVMLGRPWSGAAGRVDFAPVEGDGLPEDWVQEGLLLKFRCGGERLQPLGSPHSRPLKKWLQDAGIVPWMRARIPLLYRRNELVAVGDLWVAEAVRRARIGPRWRVLWTGHPPLR